MDREDFLAAKRRAFEAGDKLDLITLGRLIEANNAALVLLASGRRPSPLVRLN